MAIREEFSGFMKLHTENAVNIVQQILLLKNKSSIEGNSMDRATTVCLTLVRKFNGAQSILRDKYRHALFFHCASYKLNLVINGLNFVSEIWKTISTVKDTIISFRKFFLRKKCVPNIPAFHKIRWSQKYTYLSIFKENVEII